MWSRKSTELWLKMPGLWFLPHCWLEVTTKRWSPQANSSVPDLQSVKWEGHCSPLCSIWIYLWKVTCESKEDCLLLTCTLYGESRNSYDPYSFIKYNICSGPLYQINSCYLLNFFKSHAVFHFLDLSSYGLKTINRCQKDDNLGRVFWSTTFTVLISVCILP